MEFKIQKAEFLRGLRIAQSIADRKSTMPMLANVLLRVSGEDKILVAATDLNVSVSAELTSSNREEGGLTLGARALHEIVANMPGEEISLRKAENNWAEIKAGKVSYRLVGMPDRDFPRMPDHREVDYAEVNAATLRDMIDCIPTRASTLTRRRGWRQDVASSNRRAAPLSLPDNSLIVLS